MAGTVRAAVLLALLPGLAGCAMGYGFGLGVIVDTDGNVGGVASVRGSLGFSVDDGFGVSPTVALDGGGLGAPAAGVVGPGVGVEVAAAVADDALLVRGGPRVRFDLRFAGDGDRYDVEPGVAVAVLGVVAAEDFSYDAVGAEVQALLAIDLEGRRDSSGVFLLSAVYDHWYLRVMRGIPGVR